MRPIIWVPLKFSGVPEYAHGATFFEIFNGILFQSIVCMCLQNLKFVALPVPEMIGGTVNIKNFGQSLDTPTFPFLQKI